MITFINDIKHAIRQLLKSPGFTALAVLTLALGIGICTATFSLVNAVLLRPLPFHEPERLVWIENVPRPVPVTPTLSGDNFVDWRTQSKSFKELAAFDAFFEKNRYSLTGVGDPQRLRGVQVSQKFLDALGVRPWLGRNFSDEECAWNGPRAAILSHAFWGQQFEGAENVIGRTVTINGESVKIVGVLPPSDNLDVLFSPGTKVELLLPFPLTEETARFASRRWGNTLYAIGRLKPDVTLAQAQEEMAVINARLIEAYPERVQQNGGHKFGASLTPLEEHVRRPFRPAFILLSGAVLCVLLIACANLSNLLLTRANARRQEFSIRIALGASRRHLISQTMTESLILAFAGCVLGVLSISLVTIPLTRLQAFNIPLLHTASIDSTTLFVAIILTCTAAVLCGILPTLQLWRRNARDILNDTSVRGGTSRGGARMRQSLVITEIAMACMLLIGASLLIRSFISVLRVNLGFQPEHALVWNVDTARPFSSHAERIQFYDRLVERVSTVPGVESAGLSDSLPLSFKRSWSIQIDGAASKTHGALQAAVVMADQHFLQTIRISLLEGRNFEERDSADTEHVMMINETMARNFWPNQNPIGKTAVVNGPECTVVGVVADVRPGLEETPRPEMILNFRQRNLNQWHSMKLVVRAKRQPASLIPDVRVAMKEVDPALASNEFTSLDQTVDRAIAPRRLITQILGSFSSFALLLAVIGLYGIITYSVNQRSRDIGIRLAIGAQRSDVLRLVVGEGLRMAGVGVAIGLVVAFFVTRVLRSQLYGVAPNDPATFMGAGILLVTVAMLATWIPARRAAKIDPMETLRYE